MFKGFPLFDTAALLSDQADLHDYPGLVDHFEKLPVDTELARRDFEVSLKYLLGHTKRSGTYNRFRAEIQKFLNYIWLVAGRTLDQVDSEVVESYIDFFKSPPKSWVSNKVVAGFSDREGVRCPNREWRPFSTQRAAGKPYHASQSSLNSSDTILRSYFRFLLLRRVLTLDPSIGVRRNAKKETVSKESADAAGQRTTSCRRLTDDQWERLLGTLIDAADQNPNYERHLFVVVTMKSLFLRVGELAVRDVNGQPRVPTFSDFHSDICEGERVWLFYVFGKGDKGRHVTCPNAYLPYLTRWRNHLGCETPLPLPGESEPILPSARNGGLGRRTVQRAFEEAINLVVNRLMKSDDEEDRRDAAFFHAIKTETHYLRHTGAGQAIDAGANIRHISEELGHASAEFTEQVYVRSDVKKRRAAGRQRAI